jgi:hypothetical protein
MGSDAAQRRKSEQHPGWANLSEPTQSAILSAVAGMVALARREGLDARQCGGDLFGTLVRTAQHDPTGVVAECRRLTKLASDAEAYERE